MLLGPHIKQGQRLHFHCTEILPARNRSLVHVNPSPHQIRFGEMKNCSNQSFCHILLWGSRSTLALRLCSLRPYVPLRAGRCESLPHRSHMTRSGGLETSVQTAIHEGKERHQTPGLCGLHLTVIVKSALTYNRSRWHCRCHTIKINFLEELS